MNQQPARDPIDLLADEFVRCYRQGEQPTIEQFAVQHPEFADDIRTLFPLLINIEQLKDRQVHAGGKPASIGSTPMERLGDFRIIREVGRGGMGIVFEAEQQSLSRRVALKVLGSHVAPSEKQIRRFRREAEAAARLHHTNIVPIYGVGQEHGLHFYAMQFIDGVGLDVVLEVLDDISPAGDAESLSRAERAAKVQSTSLSAAIIAANSLREGYFAPAREPGNAGHGAHLKNGTGPSPVGPVPLGHGDTPAPLADTQGLPLGPLSEKKSPDRSRNRVRPLGNRYWKSVARLGRDVADALDYAHLHGILHRDVKPSNLLLDQEGNVWITDFGLAKHVESDDLTKSGDIVGTLRYMAPEQFDGMTDRRSDIYSLGVTLCEMLTLEPAFGETQQGRLIQQKMQGATPQPRSRNPHIPRDLETIVLKAVAADPQHRYPSAGELAADLQRFLEERPVAAARTRPLARFWRWCRRNPAIAISSGTAVLLLIAVAVVAVVSDVTTRAALLATQQAQSAAVAAQQRAESNLNLAIEAFDGIFDNIATRGIPQSLELEYEDQAAPRFQSVLTEADADLLRQLLTFYKQFAEQNSSDLELRAKIATAHHRIGQIHQRLGHVEDARISFREAAAIYDQLLEEHPRQVEAILAKARLLNDHGVLLGENMWPWDEVVALHRQAIQFLTDQPAGVANTAVVRYELARAHDLAGSVLFRGDFADLEMTAGAGSPGVGPLGVGPPGGASGGQWPLTPPKRKPNPGAWPWLNGQGPPRRGGPDGWSVRAGRHDGPHGFGPRADLEDIAQFNEDHLAQAHSTLASLLTEEPSHPQYRLLMAQVERHRLVHLLRSFRSNEASDSFRTARGILEQLVADFPQEPQYRLELADTLSLVSTRLTSISDEEAERDLNKAISYCKQLAAAFPHVTQYQALLVTSYRNLARVQQSSRDLAGAEANLALAHEHLLSLTTSYPAQPFYEIELALTVINLADVKRMIGDDKQDRARLLAARDALTSELARFADNRPQAADPFRRRITSALYAGLAKTLKSLGEDAGAQAANEQSARLSDDPFRPPFGRFHSGFGPPPGGKPPQHH